MTKDHITMQREINHIVSYNDTKVLIHFFIKHKSPLRDVVSNGDDNKTTIDRMGVLPLWHQGSKRAETT